MRKEDIIELPQLEQLFPWPEWSLGSKRVHTGAENSKRSNDLEEGSLEGMICVIQ